LAQNFDPDSKTCEFSPDGSRLLLGARLWDADTGRAMAFLSGHRGKIDSARFSPDGRRVFTVGEDGSARIWEADTGRELAVLDHNGAGIDSVSVSPDGRRVASSGKDQTVRVWDATSGRQIAVLYTAGSASFCPNGRRLLTVAGAAVTIWDSGASEPSSPVLTRPALGRHDLLASVSADGRRVATSGGFQDESVRVWDGTTGRELATIRGLKGGVSALRLSPDGSRLLTVDWGGMARIYETDTARLTVYLATFDTLYAKPRFSSDGRRVAAVGHQDGPWTMVPWGHQPAVWGTDDGKLRVRFYRPTGNVRSLAFDPGANRVVTTYEDGTARVWDAATGRELAVLAGPVGKIDSASFSADGTRLISAADDRKARVWDTTTGGLLCIIDGPGVGSGPAALSADGRRAVTIDWVRNAVRVWDADTGEPVSPPIAHSSGIQLASFSPDGAKVVTLSTTRVARVWGADTGWPLSPPLTHDATIFSAAFTPDGRVITASYDGTARTWDVAPDERPTEDLVGLAELLSGHRSDEGGLIVPLPGEDHLRLWDRLRAKYPEEFTVTPEQARAWRKREIRDCLREGNLAAAQFHYWAQISDAVQAGGK
jgi:WD40 repeat protein